ncbi:17224_t:CDS:2 [Acaulospora colombiana]|uniref:17224_t:CDS:1 n=1 Tax=Acaulospora colombiana TaxID=27376 RepID=A0ACA9LKR3_9GLOM|nr:17224_t:CDS:2 [Acaulospora colombiana]
MDLNLDPNYSAHESRLSNSNSTIAKARWKLLSSIFLDNSSHSTPQISKRSHRGFDLFLKQKLQLSYNGYDDYDKVEGRNKVSSNSQANEEWGKSVCEIGGGMSSLSGLIQGDFHVELSERYDETVWSIHESNLKINYEGYVPDTHYPLIVKAYWRSRSFPDVRLDFDI